MSENFAKINSVREIVNFSEDNDFKQEIFQNVDFKNFGNSHQLQTHSRLEFPTLSQEKNPKKIGLGRVLHGKRLIDLCRRANLAGIPPALTPPGDPVPQPEPLDHQSQAVPDGNAPRPRK